MNAVTSAKDSARQQVRARRAARSAQNRNDESTHINAALQNLASEINARSVAAFLPTATEPDITDFLNWALAEGIEVLLPVSREDGLMNWIRTADATPTRAGLHNMPEVHGEELGPDTIGRVDLILAPAASVDRHGVRLGWGRGYFDRTLAYALEHAKSQTDGFAKLAPMFAVVFADELVDQLPREPHDVLATGAVTPEGVVRFS